MQSTVASSHDWVAQALMGWIMEIVPAWDYEIWNYDTVIWDYATMGHNMEFDDVKRTDSEHKMVSVSVDMMRWQDSLQKHISKRECSPFARFKKTPFQPNGKCWATCLH